MASTQEISSTDAIKNELSQMAMKGEWKEVVNIYVGDKRAHKVKITKSGDTALHIAASDDKEDIVERLIKEISANGEEGKEALKVKNERGNTALHVAASMGSVGMCQRISQVDISLVGVRNGDGETPFFLAALHGRKEAFLCLLRVCRSGSKDIFEDYSRRNDGDTILHVAVAGDYFDLAYQIIQLYPELVNSVNEEGFTPLHLLAGNPSNFKSGSHLGLYGQIISHCILVERLHLDPRIKKNINAPSRGDPSDPQPTNAKYIPKFLENAFTRCIHKIISFWKVDLEVNNKGKIIGDLTSRDLESNTGSEVTRRAQAHQLFPPNYITRFEFLKFPFKAVLVIFGLGHARMKRIVEMKKKHTWSVQIMEELVKSASSYKYGNTGTSPLSYSTLPPYLLSEPPSTGTSEDREDEDNYKSRGTGISKVVDTPILIAAKYGITEIVDKILQDFPFAIHDVNIEKKNMVLLAVENRQPHLYEFLLKKKNLRNWVFQAVDNEGNSALHLAAKFGEYNIASAMSKMHWEIKWYEFVKESMPDDFFPRYNRQHKTPEDLFTETHKDLVEKSDALLNKTSESCSIIAGLIATVAFATSVTVPGGVNQNSGTPMLVNEPAFNVFAISSLVALCFSIMAVITFHVAILKSRCQKQDMGSTSIKFLVGSTSLFVSIAAMLISFCAGHYLLLRDKLKHAAIPVYATACLLITFYTMVQFSFYFDIVRAMFNKVPPRNYKADSLF